MAAVTAPLTQDVPFKNFQQEESSVEDIEEIVDESRDNRDSECETKAEAPEDEADVIVVVGGGGGGSGSDGENQNKPSHSAGGTFKLGIDDGSELMDELSFSLQHCGVAGGGVEGQPPPGHWVSQPHGKYPYSSLSLSLFSP